MTTSLLLAMKLSSRPVAAVQSLACLCLLQKPLSSFAFAPTRPTTRTFTSYHYSSSPYLQYYSSSTNNNNNNNNNNKRTIMAAATEAKESFPTWTYDKPCATIVWNELVPASLNLQENVALNSIQDAEAAADLVIVGVLAPRKDDEDEDEEESEDEEEEEMPAALSGLAKKLDESLNGALSDCMTENCKTFKNGAKAGSMTPTVRLATTTTPSSCRYIVMGLGKTPKKDDDDGDKDDPLTADGVGSTLGKAVAEKCNAEKKVKTVKVLLPDALTSNATSMQDFATSFYQTLYSDNRYRTGKKVKKVAQDLEAVTICSEGTAAVVDAQVLDQGRKMATGIFLTKDIVNSPHNVLNSQSLADTAKRIAKQSEGGRIKCSILDKKECEKRGMGAYLGVARGSETEPQFIHLTYTPPSSKINKKVGIIGKGLLFDTGGYNIKTQMMELMKFDCGGAAAVLGAARAVGALQPEGVEAHFIVAACSNMINEKAMVPSDILTASNGKTIEVMNTDAEGRLTLADALVFADKEAQCETIIELSTLTGACMVSLGKQIAGVWTSNDDLAKELEDVSKVTGDKSWRMPLEQAYNEQLESKFADIKNIGTRYGGAITAALFLQNFVSRKKPFAHIDIAGPVWNDKLGATGFGAKLVAEWVRRQGLSSDTDD